ncbi:MAG: tetratricopeptide repeat protein [Proteobacteria bacterium]|nr:tetratricopeptide repeat protein [Pseudomonadota bacterium]
MKYAALLALVFISACANPIVEETAREYYLGGRRNAEQGNWKDARIAFGRALANADLGHVDDKRKAVLAYDYGRASGVICDWAESESGLKRALELDTKTNGPVHMSLLELARMYHAKGDLESALQHFRMGRDALDNLHADTQDPVGYVDILHEYRSVLTEAGNADEARTVSDREAEVRKRLKGSEPKHDHTPYGQHCE